MLGFGDQGILRQVEDDTYSIIADSGSTAGNHTGGIRFQQILKQLP